jgi:hypothetical protein
MKKVLLYAALASAMVLSSAAGAKPMEKKHPMHHKHMHHKPMHHKHMHHKKMMHKKMEHKKM